MKVAVEYDFYDLYNNSWGGAISTLDIILDHHKENELMQHLEEVFGDIVDATQLNDYLWFDSYYLLYDLDIDVED